MRNPQRYLALSTMCGHSEKDIGYEIGRAFSSEGDHAGALISAFPASRTVLFCFVFSVFVLFAFQFSKILLIHPLAQRTCLQSCPVYKKKNKNIKGIFHFCYSIFISSIHFFLVLSQDFHFYVFISHLFLLAVYFIHQSPQHIHHSCFIFSA